MSFIERLRDARNNITPSNPWLPLLVKLRGQRGSDGVERLTTEHIFDILDVPLSKRTPQAARTICSAMVALGWSPIRLRSASSRGRSSRVRGYGRLI
jgi:hypothetical protein